MGGKELALLCVQAGQKWILEYRYRLGRLPYYCFLGLFAGLDDVAAEEESKYSRAQSVAVEAVGCRQGISR